MTRRRPQLRHHTRICILCEGYEEHDYMRKLISLAVWHPEYDITLVNAEGQGNLFARYQNYYQMGSYDAIFLITDTDAKPYEHYLRLKAKLNRHHHKRTAARQLLYYGNPCTMQFILLHWAEPDELKLKSPAKRDNAEKIRQLTGIEHYHARKSQRRKLCAQITEKNYHSMVARAKKIAGTDKQLGSTNIADMMDKLEQASKSWLSSYTRSLN